MENFICSIFLPIFGKKWLKNYWHFVTGKTAKSILISCGARLAPFDIAELRELTSYDEMELDMLGDQRTAMFVIISDTDDTFNFIVAIMYSQLFNLLCDRADDVYGGRLPYHVRILADELNNLCSNEPPVRQAWAIIPDMCEPLFRS